MAIQKYSVNQHPIQTLLTWVESGEIAIPEIQRPFVWSAIKVRDLIDSLYQGYPVGYLIAWKNPNVRLKDGSTAAGKRILIDGQQRVTALMASLLGTEVINQDYQRVTIRIAFHPIKCKFEVSNPAIRKDKEWIANIGDLRNPDLKMLRYVSDYCEANGLEDQDAVYENIDRLKGIVNNHIGLIELNSDLDIETVTEIFIRINSAGAVLSQADFAMSKIAANEEYGGHMLRKCIDYFCHLAVAPEFYPDLQKMDQEFAKTPFFQKMSWLKNENDDLYDPSYTDMLRVAFTSEFRRGKLEDLVALLSGRNFETKQFEASIAEASFLQLEHGIVHFMNETNFKNFVMIIRSAGFVVSSMIGSQNVLNFAYILYLTMRDQGIPPAKIETITRRWLVLSLITQRYSSSPESAFDADIKRIHEIGTERYLRDVEEAELSEAFWNAGLPQAMQTSSSNSPFFKTFLAAQVYGNDKGFLSKEITVQSLLMHKGDVHHIFPRSYLKRHGLSRGKYNQIANYVVMQSEINIAIGDDAPAKYFSAQLLAASNGDYKYGAINQPDALKANFALHCLPDGIEKMTIDHYEEFLESRRQLMAWKIRDYYQKL